VGVASARLNRAVYGVNGALVLCAREAADRVGIRCFLVAFAEAAEVRAAGTRARLCSVVCIENTAAPRIIPLRLRLQMMADCCARTPIVDARAVALLRGACWGGESRLVCTAVMIGRLFVAAAGVVAGADDMAAPFESADVVAWQAGAGATSMTFFFEE